MRESVAQAVRSIQPYDSLEAEHKDVTLDWIASGAPLYRTQKPDVPPQHLVSYFVVFDPEADAALLVNHRLAGLWLPPGGHVEPDEHPRTTVIRESREELGLEARFFTTFGDNPFFITVTETRGSGTHTDVSLWYVIEGSRHRALAYDDREFGGYQWLSIHQILDIDGSELDPHMHRFLHKLATYL